MTTGRFQHCFQGPSGEAKDTYCNTYHFLFESNEMELQAAAVATQVRAWYGGLEFGGNSIWSSVVENAGASVKAYRLQDPPQRPVIHEEFYTPSFPQRAGASNLPNEVAICLSYNAEPVAGAIRARNRGRIYLGPLNQDAMSAATGQDPEVAPSVVTDILAGAVQLRASLFAIGVIWCIFSPTNFAAAGAGADPDDFMYPIVNFSVDNALDTQRRRGTAASTRSQLPI